MDMMKLLLVACAAVCSTVAGLPANNEPMPQMLDENNEANDATWLALQLRKDDLIRSKRENVLLKDDDDSPFDDDAARKALRVEALKKVLYSIPLVRRRRVHARGKRHVDEHLIHSKKGSRFVREAPNKSGENNEQKNKNEPNNNEENKKKKNNFFYNIWSTIINVVKNWYRKIF